jgi:hypothetical protein
LIKKSPDSTSGSPQSRRMLKFLKNFHIYIYIARFKLSYEW